MNKINTLNKSACAARSQTPNMHLRLRPMKKIPNKYHTKYHRPHTLQTVKKKQKQTVTNFRCYHCCCLYVRPATQTKKKKKKIPKHTPHTALSICYCVVRVQ